VLSYCSGLLPASTAAWSPSHPLRFRPGPTLVDGACGQGLRKGGEASESSLLDVLIQNKVEALTPELGEREAAIAGELVYQEALRTMLHLAAFVRDRNRNRNRNGNSGAPARAWHVNCGTALPVTCGTALPRNSHGEREEEADEEEALEEGRRLAMDLDTAMITLCVWLDDRARVGEMLAHPATVLHADHLEPLLLAAGLHHAHALLLARLGALLLCPRAHRERLLAMGAL